ncbi:MAG TPA: PEP-CTERM sorting domain-containing protein [Bryobacteraceae bacterium]|nr:PEP-CTERM sorting domain-containing protein [Bryobacteraceae bacterium]
MENRRGLGPARGVFGRLFTAALLFTALFAGAPSRLKADLLDVTSLLGYIDQVDTSTNTITTLLNTHGLADSLVFAPGNLIVFSEPNAGRVGIYNTVTQNLKWVYGFSQPRDITLDPSGTSVLVSDDGDQHVKRVDLTQQYPVPETLPAWLDDIDGITYDNAGHLFVVQSWLGYVAQIDPTTGYIIKRYQCPACWNTSVQQLDGITFDPSSGELWVAATLWNGLWEFNTSLTSATLHAANHILSPDGVEADGNGNIFAASQGGNWGIDEYNIATGVTIQLTTVPYIDDIAPITGLGSPQRSTPSSVPEPSAITLLGAALLVIGSLRRRRRGA